MHKGYRKSGQEIKDRLERRWLERRWCDVVGTFVSDTFFDRHQGWTRLKQRVYKKGLSVKSLDRVGRCRFRSLPDSFYKRHYS